VSENVTTDFQDGFIVDVEPNQKEGYILYCISSCAVCYFVYNSADMYVDRVTLYAL